MPVMLLITFTEYHGAGAYSAMCDRAYVMENGRITLEGTGAELMENDQVREAFLGI